MVLLLSLLLLSLLSLSWIQRKHRYSTKRGKDVSMAVVDSAAWPGGKSRNNLRNQQKQHDDGEPRTTSSKNRCWLTVVVVRFIMAERRPESQTQPRAETEPSFLSSCLVSSLFPLSAYIQSQQRPSSRGAAFVLQRARLYDYRTSTRNYCDIYPGR